MRLLRARGSAELRKVASGSAMQGLWLRYRKVGSQVIGKTKASYLEEAQLGKLGEEEKEDGDPATEQRRK